MQNAYTVQPFQIVGGPDWINSERYAIDAKAAGNASRAQIFLMLQSLLEDRFQLKIHRETRELPVFDLVTAKGGLKLPPPKEGGCEDSAGCASRAEQAAEWRRRGAARRPWRGAAASSVMLQAGGARM